MLQEIKMLKEIDYEQYKNIYLGLPANLVGTIYKNFDYERHTGKTGQQGSYIKMDIGVDYGVVDATVFTLKGMLSGWNGMEIPRSFYHKNGVSIGNYLQEDYIERFFEQSSMWYETFGISMTVWVDSANKDFKDTLEREIVRRNKWYLVIGNLNKMTRSDKIDRKRGEIRKKDMSVIQGRINFKNRMLGSDYILYDREECEELIKATQEAEYDKWNDRLDDGSVNVDSLDSEEYSWLDAMELIDDKIYMKRGVINGAKQEQTT